MYTKIIRIIKKSEMNLFHFTINCFRKVELQKEKIRKAEQEKERKRREEERKKE